MLTVYRIPAKEHQVVERSATNKASVLKTLLWKYLENVPLILHDYKRLTSTKSKTFTISSALSAQFF